jgi:hypothetical protein
MKQKYILFTLWALFSFKAIAQTNYSVASIPFQPFSGNLAPLMTADDTYSPVIDLPFSFDFYGINYNQIVVSTNGYIDFRTNLAGQFSPWSISQITIPNTGFNVKNSIFGCYEDLNNNVGSGSITYGSYGTAPYRKFVVYFNNQPHFQCGNAVISSFQMILSETSNIIDIQLIGRQVCGTWNGGRGVVGLINIDGSVGITPPGRNTGNWTASQEGWRFSRPGYYSRYDFVRCDDDEDGTQVFDLSVAANDISAGNPSSISFFTDIALTSPIVNATAYTNTNNPQTIYAVGNGVIKEVKLEVIDCAIDADNDTVATSDEDINSDTNLANDDTDADGIPNYLDNDDDGDMVLTNVEYVFARTNGALTINALLDTDGDGILNYLDNDDDGDGLLTILEDYNGDGNPANDDTNSNGLADYLESAVTLGASSNQLSNAIELYPNPVSSEFNIRNLNGDLISNVAIYAINGSLIKEVKTNNSSQNISVSDLQSGVYFVRVTSNDKVSNLKFIKK